MAEIINLNRAKKTALIKAAKVQADANCVKFGQTKAAKTAQKKNADKVQRDLDGHKR